MRKDWLRKDWRCRSLLRPPARDPSANGIEPRMPGIDQSTLDSFADFLLEPIPGLPPLDGGLQPLDQRVLRQLQFTSRSIGQRSMQAISGQSSILSQLHCGLDSEQNLRVGISCVVCLSDSGCVDDGEVPKGLSPAREHPIPETCCDRDGGERSNLTTIDARPQVTTIHPITRRGIAMNTRILSWVVNRVVLLAIMAITISVFSSKASGQSSSGYLTDPETGIVYRKVTKTIETPSSKHMSIQRANRLSTSNRHRNSTTRSNHLLSRGRVQVGTTGVRPLESIPPPSVGYQHVPHATWEARNEIVHRTNTRTEWVAERRTVEMPTQIVRMQREQKVEFEPVGQSVSLNWDLRVATDALASRLRPWTISATIQPFGQSSIYNRAATGLQHRIEFLQGSTRSPMQEGMRPNDLAPTAPPGGVLRANHTTGVANARPLPVYR